jgi:hypothetical protein
VVGSDEMLVQIVAALARLMHLLAHQHAEFRHVAVDPNEAAQGVKHSDRRQLDSTAQTVSAWSTTEISSGQTGPCRQGRLGLKNSKHPEHRFTR